MPTLLHSSVMDKFIAMPQERITGRDGDRMRWKARTRAKVIRQCLHYLLSAWAKLHLYQGPLTSELDIILTILKASQKYLQLNSVFHVSQACSVENTHVTDFSVKRKLLCSSKSILDFVRGKFKPSSFVGKEKCCQPTVLRSRCGNSLSGFLGSLGKVDRDEEQIYVPELDFEWAFVQTWPNLSTEKKH